MVGSLKALGVTLKSMGRRKVTAEYPKEHLPVDERYMGFPALLWDSERDEPFCTGCMVCVRYCPTQCMSAEMKDNPKFASGDSHRRKIIESFEINLNRCILCGICVDVCNFDAIEMSHEHELAGRGRNDRRMDLPQLLTMGKKYQAETAWKPSKPNAASPKEKEAQAAAAAAAAASQQSSSTEGESAPAARVAQSPTRLARQPSSPPATAGPAATAPATGPAATDPDPTDPATTPPATTDPSTTGQAAPATTNDGDGDSQDKEAAAG